MKQKILIIISPKNFRDEELNISYDFFQERNFEVVVASEKAGKVRGIKGSTIDVFQTFDNINVDDFKAIILVGGEEGETFWKNKILHNLLKEADTKKKIIAATYKSPVTLAYAGILKNKRATVWIEEKDILDEYGAFFTGASIEIDDNIITSDGPHSTKMFVEELYNLLKKKENDS